MRFVHIIPLLFILLEGCVDPLKIELLPGTQKLVVDGLITNEPGPYEVKLSYSTSIDNALKKAVGVTGAAVWIYDNANHSEKLIEVSPGVYQTNKNGIAGVVGREYYVKITTKAGREYRSQSQRLTSAGEISTVGFEFQLDGLPGNTTGEYTDAVKILVDAKGVEKELNLLRWRWTTIYKVRSFPELRVNFPPSSSVPVPFPEPCSGYVADPSEQPRGIRQVSECTCCICWAYNYSPTALISHNRIIDGLEFKKVDLGKIPVGTQEFYDKYYLNVEQLSVSEEVYNFWTLAEKQEAANGNLFQPNSIKVRGNIKSMNDPDEEVLGIFGVSGITRKELYISPAVVPYTLPPLDTIKQNCSGVLQNPSVLKPSFW
jgi:hypothetical protein